MMLRVQPNFRYTQLVFPLWAGLSLCPCRKHNSKELAVQILIVSTVDAGHSAFHLKPIELANLLRKAAGETVQ